MPSADIGPLGAAEGEFTVCSVGRFPRLWQLLPWILVAFLLVRYSSRTAEVWKLFVPLVGLHVVAAGVPRLPFGIPSEALALLAMVVNATAFGLAGIWAVSRRWIGLGRARTIATALALGIAVAVAASLSAVNWCFKDDVAVPLIIVAAIMSASSIGGLALGAFFCRRRYSRGRLLGLSAVGTFCVVCLGMLPFALFALTQGMPAAFLVTGFLAYVGAIAGLCCVVWVPFMILAFRCVPYRECFHGVLRLPGMMCGTEQTLASTATEEHEEGPAEPTFDAEDEGDRP